MLFILLKLLAFLFYFATSTSTATITIMILYKYRMSWLNWYAWMNWNDFHSKHMFVIMSTPLYAARLSFLLLLYTFLCALSFADECSLVLFKLKFNESLTPFVFPLHISHSIYQLARKKCRRNLREQSYRKHFFLTFFCCHYVPQFLGDFETHKKCPCHNETGKQKDPEEEKREKCATFFLHDLISMRLCIHINKFFARVYLFCIHFSCTTRFFCFINQTRRLFPEEKWNICK